MTCTLNKDKRSSESVPEQTKQQILVVTAVEAEREAVLAGLQQAHQLPQSPSSDIRFEVVAVGVGPIAAAVKTTKMLAAKRYDLVVSAGIGGGFPGRAEVSSLVVASEIIAADLGAESPEGFSDLQELGFGTTRIVVQPRLLEQVRKAFSAAQMPAVIGPVLTVSTVTGTAESAARLAERVPGAAAEAMEGYGAALAASEFGIPVLELRTVSNLVGPRDRAAWKIKEALAILAKASAVLAESLARAD